VLLGGNAQLVVEGVVPDLLHVVPVGHDAVLDGVLEGQDTALGLRFIANVGVLLSHADHDTLVTGATDERGENSAGGIIAGETSFNHTGAVVDDKGGHFFFSHIIQEIEQQCSAARVRIA